MVASARATQRQPDGPGEYSWGPGLTPPGLQDARPDEGGIYRGTSPAIPANPTLDALAERLDRRP